MLIPERRAVGAVDGLDPPLDRHRPLPWPAIRQLDCQAQARVVGGRAVGIGGQLVDGHLAALADGGPPFIARVGVQGSHGHGCGPFDRRAETQTDRRLIVVVGIDRLGRNAAEVMMTFRAN